MSISQLTQNPPNNNSNYYSNSFTFEEYLRANPITTAERNGIIGANGTLIYNSTNNEFEGYVNGTWIPIGETGPTGSVGPQGPTGATGAIGPTGATGGLVLISSQILSVTGASISFNSIPQTYNNLNIMIQAQSDQAVDSITINCNYNGDTGTNYANNQLISTAINTTGNDFLTEAYARYGIISGTNYPLYSSVNNIYIPNYTRTTYYKTSISTAMSYYYMTTTGSIWANNSTITSIVLTPSAGNFLAGSTFYLYGY